MEAAMMLLPLLLLAACTAHALPVEADASIKDVTPVPIEHPRMEDLAEDADSKQARVRRSPEILRQGGNGGGFPLLEPQPQQAGDSIGGVVRREKRDGAGMHWPVRKQRDLAIRNWILKGDPADTADLFNLDRDDWTDSNFDA